MRGEIRHNVFIEDAVELTWELVRDNMSKLLQMKYVTEFASAEAVRRRHISYTFASYASSMLKKDLSLEAKKKHLLSIVKMLKNENIGMFPKVGWWDRKVALALALAGQEEGLRPCSLGGFRL